MDVYPGIIPAYAGSTVPIALMATAFADHPRIRGEHGGSKRRLLAINGSSPHTRGALQDPTEPSQENMDHPRIRGEHLANAASITNPYGSSPHTRGARAHRGAEVPPDGIIPAYAGSTQRRVGVEQPPQDHPRIRGEHGSAARPPTRTWGSSPHTRGAHVVGSGGAAAGGIIPAYAGSTEVQIPLFRILADHPRIRGEHKGGNVEMTSRSGSSPHTRGAQTRPTQESHRPRIIPAYAGSTLRAASAASAGVDHPRIRGEHPLTS